MRGRQPVGCGTDPGSDVAALLELLPPVSQRPTSQRRPAADCALQRWMDGGAFALTGRPGQVPRAPQAPVADRISAAVDLLAEVTGQWGDGVELDPGPLLTARAAEAGLARGGNVSANGSCVLVTSVNGWAAVNLARPDDVAAAAEYLGVLPDELRPALASACARPGVLDTLRALEIPVAELGEAVDVPAMTLHRAGVRGPLRRPLVLDLSAMWAGPLAASLLGRAGARVLKVEDPVRPDGARFGPPRFFADLHRGQELLSLSLRDDAGRAALDALLAQADVVVESSRPRALRQLGIDAEAWVAGRAGRTWISITGYGRSGPGANRVAFGDDAAVAGGLVAGDDDGPVFCADAVADPLTGLYAGLAGAAAVAAGGGYLVDVAMAGVCAHVNRPGPPPREHVVEAGPGGWTCAHPADVVRC